MQLIANLKNRLFTRMFVTSLSIIALVGFGFAWLVIQLNAQSQYNQATANLISELPVIAAEFQESNLVPITQAQDNDNIETSYIMATCDNQFNSLWRSTLAKQSALDNICENYRQSLDGNKAYYLSFHNDQTYLVYKLSTLIDQKSFHLLILKDAQKIKQNLKKFKRLTYFRLAMVLGGAIFLLISAAYWGLLPLKRLKQELLKLKQGKQQQFSNNYPIELQEITQALNQLVDQNEQRQARYQNAMNDLAHSLKTRLAASVAIIDDKQLTANEKQLQILSQIEDMDHLVKYQLKRAMMGRQGLLHEQTDIKPIIDQIVQLLSKLYQHKHIHFMVNCPNTLLVPISKADLMELCGNIIENAAKFCISSINITASTTADMFNLTVDDDGPGIDETYRQKVIQRGVRVDTQYSGQGIGLAVCHELVTSYSGTLEIQTSTLQGASIIIAIPLASN
ncbi:ATP-binding protein [Shewanella aestuarii]|uniref:histidine kinase n=1 Tax=Shewanella aestuarii TaxID=1028752 RepID=A0A6G9QJT1_9GAMM|nr:ATP-binding protein [Shewanella aestuarii]QIR14824.1 histidine kinase [Shewanella aestuarii]